MCRISCINLKMLIKIQLLNKCFTFDQFMSQRVDLASMIFSLQDVAAKAAMLAETTALTLKAIHVTQLNHAIKTIKNN